MIIKNRPDISFAIVFLTLFLVYVVRSLISADVALLPPTMASAWITYPVPELTGTYRENNRTARQAVFRKFVGANIGKVEITIMALQNFQLFVNQTLVFDSQTLKNWKWPSNFDLGPYLTAERNEIRVMVQNPKGPPLLAVTNEAGAAGLDTTQDKGNEKWEVSRDGEQFVDAIVADDTLAMTTVSNFPTSWYNLVSKGNIMVLLFAMGAVMYAVIMRRRDYQAGPRLPLMALGAVSLVWLVLFFLKHSHIPVTYGFDAEDHVFYINYILREKALPLPHVGWETFQPPLFYILAASFFRLGYMLGGNEGALIALKALPMLCGLGVVWVTFLLSRLVFPGEYLRQTLAVVIAGLSPMGLYMSGYLSNESVHAMLLGIYILAGARVLSRPNSGLLPMLGMGIAWGIAMLSKMTAAPFLFVGLVFVGLKLRRSEGLPWSDVVIRLAGITGVGLVVCGWFYARNISLYGTPLIGNFDLIYFWQQPGYHTVQYYLNFGASLVQPYFAGAQSFWDGVYASFWTDTFVGGRINMDSRHMFWNYTYMSAISILALPATILVAWGHWTTIRESLSNLKDRLSMMKIFLVCSVIVMAALIVHYTLTFPYWSTAKSFYGWGLLSTMAVLGADGFARLHHRVVNQTQGIIAGSLFYGWITALSGTILLSFFA